LGESNIDLFLDTTIQLERKLSKTQELKKLQETFKEANRVLTSTYVKMEYRRSLVQDWVYIYNVLSEVENFGDLLLRINALTPYSQRRINRMIGSLAQFFREGISIITESLGKELIEISLHYFRLIIEFSMEDFDDSVSFIINETDCYNAKVSPSLRENKFDNHTVHCKPSDIKCRIIEFFKKNIDEFKIIYEKLLCLPSLDNEQERMKGILEKALKYPQNMADYRNCWRCADSIIAVECPQEAILYTTNEKHFNPICEKIGKRLQTFRY